MKNLDKQGNYSFFQRLLFSNTLLQKSKNVKIAYVAIATTFVSATNMFFEFKFLEVQFSLTLAVSILVGILLGALPGFCACFLGDLVGFLYNSGGYAYLPWIGLSLGLASFIGGFIMSFLPNKGKFTLYLKLTFVCLLTFLLCTVAINTTAFWILYSKTDYFTYLISRLFVQGQIYNSIINYAILFVLLPVLRAIKPLNVNC